MHYGNEDFSGDIKGAWLVSQEERPALTISAYEQVKFMNDLWTNQLPVSKRAMRITQDISFLEFSPQGYKLSGKTGSNFYSNDFNSSKRIGFGWFISHLVKEDQEYIAVVNFSDQSPVDIKKPKGLEAKKIVKNILLDEGFW